MYGWPAALSILGTHKIVLLITLRKKLEETNSFDLLSSFSYLLGFPGNWMRFCWYCVPDQSRAFICEISNYAISISPTYAATNDENYKVVVKINKW